MPGTADADARSDRRRRFWERQPDEAPAPPTPPAPDLGATQYMPPVVEAPAPRRTTNALAPSGHLGTLPRTQTPPPVPDETTPQPPPSPAVSRSVTPTSIRPASRQQDRPPRKARLRLARIDPWSVMKTTLLFGVAAAIMMVVATGVVFYVLDRSGLYGAVNDMVSVVFSSDSVQFDIRSYVNIRRAIGVAALIGTLDVVIITALSTIAAGLYNLAANVMGGVEITLAED
ncbi:MAG: DUF3566 domain-containing protein [Propionibacteriaceae bacterium]|nr:DUF3566 domain-containing protein [Propionibacteriaceae bacterium]